MLLKYGKVHLLCASSVVGIISAFAMQFHLRNSKSKSPKFDDQMINQLSPIFDTSTESGRAAGRLEKFSHYVARQLGFKGESECVGLCELVQEYLKRYSNSKSFWSEAAANAVVVEADAFKETDVIYRALSSRGHHNDMLQTAELVHQNSTDAASSLLVTALNEGRDVIMDGTLSWEPFVEQTIAMARNVHKHRYRMGEGYKVAEDGTITENYWEQIEQEQGEESANKISKPYRIELVGVVCDPYLAVVRGIRRAIATGRAVRVKPQLKSHKRFANAFPKYCELVDNARLYCTNALGSKPPLIAWKDGENKMLVEPEDIKCLEMVKKLKEEAESIYELYEGDDVLSLQTPGSVWKDMVLIPTRSTLQQELKTAILKIENRGK
ncbi:hypothetical protein R3W88_016912 [Solanum pinnatisectum]|uniref:Zeta toxin domain-containing protein n=1 Tax=Solanum pinnatisectum TaxID=50273 RepID=A0AAV9KZ51_9SOLN|nr:hypothetical protein R3W88_016912 [Solanum pinnatisectum]